MNADGTNPIRLTHNDEGDGYPAWSPDGTMLAFDSGRNSPGGEIYIINIDGSNLRRLTDSPEDEGYPAW